MRGSRQSGEPGRTHRIRSIPLNAAVFLLVSSLVSRAAGPPRPHEDQETESATAYAIAVTVPQTSFTSGSPIAIHMVVTNGSRQRIWVLCPLEDTRYSVWDNRGHLARRKVSTVILIDRHGQHTVGRRVHIPRGVWRALQPGQTVEDAALISDAYDLSRPGQYFIQASRADPETGDISKSNVVSITVLPKAASGRS